MNNWFCYILKNNHRPHKNRTYNGSTNNPKRRLRQHNQEIVGGARYTKKYGNKSWEIYALVTGFPDHRNTLQCEWRIKHPDNRRNRHRKYNTPTGRVIGLNEVLQCDKWTKQSIHDNTKLKLKLWIIREYAEYINGLPDHVEVIVVDKIDPDNLEISNTPKISEETESTLNQPDISVSNINTTNANN